MTALEGQGAAMFSGAKAPIRASKRAWDDRRTDARTIRIDARS